MATKRIKFIKAWQMVPVGAVRDFDTPIADLLIQNGRAKEIEAGAPVPVSDPTLKIDAKAMRRAMRKARKR